MTIHWRLRFYVVTCLVCAILASTGTTAGWSVGRTDDLVWATGHVADASGQPVAGALVAVYDDGNHVVDFARTDKNGDYALAVPEKAMHLERRHGKAFLAEVFGNVTRFVGSTVGFMANPVSAGIHAVTSSEAAGVVDPLARGGIAVGGAVFDKAMFAVTPRPKSELGRMERKQPGALLIKVVAPDQNDLLGITHVYWVEDEVSHLGGKQKRTTAAWLDPIQLASASSDKPSKADSDYLRFAAARLIPSLAVPGQTVRIVAKLKAPPDPVTNVVVVARNDRTGDKWELHPGLNGEYECDVRVDRRFPRDDQHISILAYAASEQKPGRRPDAERAIEAAGLWNAKTPYVYDPLLVASRNRIDLTLTIIPGEQHVR